MQEEGRTFLSQKMNNFFSYKIEYWSWNFYRDLALKKEEIKSESTSNLEVIANQNNIGITDQNVYGLADFASNSQMLTNQQQNFVDLTSSQEMLANQISSVYQKEGLLVIESSNFKNANREFELATANKPKNPEIQQQQKSRSPQKRKSEHVEEADDKAKRLPKITRNAKKGKVKRK